MYISTDKYTEHHAKFYALVKSLVLGHLGKKFPRMGNGNTYCGYNFLFISRLINGAGNYLP